MTSCIQIRYYQKSTRLDQFLAVAYFQEGVSNFLIGNFEEALSNFNDTLLYLRGNNSIDYEQLGLKYKLYSCEVLFNRGLCYVYLRQNDQGIQDMKDAAKEKVTDDHTVIDEAIEEKAEGYTVFSIPVGVVFRPNEAKVKNIRARDYLGKPQLIRQASAGAPEYLNGAPHRRNFSADTWSRDDRPPEKFSHAATNLVKPDLTSNRTRQQSEPPMPRTVFPPTPPPENENHAFTYNIPTRSNDHLQQPHSSEAARSAHSIPDRGYVPPPRSSSATRTRPEKLELGAAAFDHAKNASASTSKSQPTTRGSARSASERPAERRPFDTTDLRTHMQPSRERLFGAVDHNESAEETSARLMQDHSRSTPTSGGSAPRSRGTPRGQSHAHHRIDEEDEEYHYTTSTEKTGLTPNSGIIAQRGPTSGGQPSHTGGKSPTTSTAKHARPSAPRTPSSKVNANIRSLRVKVHFKDDTRYIIVAPTIAFTEFLEQVCKKVGIVGTRKGSGIKIKMKDEEGDLITMGDEEDWSLAVATARAMARREEVEMGKMEVCYLFLSNPHGCEKLTFCFRSGLRRSNSHYAWSQSSPFDDSDLKSASYHATSHFYFKTLIASLCTA